MFEPKQFLTLNIHEKQNHSNSSQKSMSNSVTLNGANTPTITYTCTPTDEIRTPSTLIQLDNLNHYSLSSLTSIASQPHLPYHNSSNQSHDHQSNHSYYSSSSHTFQLPESDTPLTPNIAAVAHTITNFPPNTFIINDDNFSLETISTASTKSKSKIKLKSKSKSKSSSNHDQHEEHKVIECKDTKNNNIDYRDEKNECNHDHVCDIDVEVLFLRKRGYKRGKKIATTLQGFVYEIESLKNGHKYVVKQTDKQLHKKGITVQNGKKYAVKEDILNEKGILQIISKQNAPSFMVKYIDFFQSENYYYLVMEHGGNDLFQFILNAHQHIQNGKLSIKEWRKFIKYIFWQMSVLLLWLHNTCNAAHLDVSLENILVKNAKFIDMGNGQLSISTNIQIKFCDFGLAEFYCPDADADDLSAFKSSKYCGKTNYKSPQVFSKNGEFDGRKADVWSLGVVLFCMAIGAPPYKRPHKDDECYNSFIKKGYIAHLLYHWKRHHYVTERMLSLLKGLLTYDESNRFCMDDVVTHPWLRSYHSKYYQLIKPDLLATKYANN